MTAQLSLFGPRTPAAPATCPRVPGPLCADAGRLVGGCPGAAACEAWTGQRPGVAPARPSPTLVSVVAQANAELGKDADAIALLSRAIELAAGRLCGACGCTEAEHPITLYERAPLAGQYRCWACAQAALEST